MINKNHVIHSLNCLIYSTRVSRVYCVNFISFIALLVACNAYSQQDEEYKLESSKQGWTIESSIGLDFLSNLLINPAVGGGQNRLGLGATLEFKSLLNKNKWSWENYLNIDFGVQKVGQGFLEDYPDKKVPFQKNIDNIWFNSRATLRTSYFSNYYFAFDSFFTSQITETFEDNFLKDITERGHPISKFLSPATFQASLGMEYRPNNYWKFFVSPASYKAIIVVDDDIANDFVLNDNNEFAGSVHGNPYIDNMDGTVTFMNVDNQIGGAIRVLYNNDISERFSMNSNLSLFSNYLDNPDHIDVNIRNTVDFTVFKGLKLSLI